MTSILNLSGKDLDRELDKIIQNGIRYHYWTPKEDEILTRLYRKGVVIRKIAEALNRTPKSLDARIRTLGLSRRKP